MLRPGDPGYDDARHIWNGLIDRRPALIVRCANPGDVQRSIHFAREQELDLSVKGGGHGVAGKAVADGGLMLDLSLLSYVWVDPARRIARAGGGATWGSFDRATQAHGLATTGGIVPTTGVGGLTLGGGLGYLMRRCGLACDSLISAEVVTADGEVLTASEDVHPDLFWALRGGGGNFGVVTSFEFRLHEIGPTVLGGFVFHPFAHAMDVAHFYREFTAQAPDELTTDLAFATSPEGQPVVAFIVCYSGPLERGEEVLRPLRIFGSPVADTIAALPYVDMQGLAAPLYPPGRLNYWKSGFLSGLDDAVIEIVIERFANVPSPLSAIVFEHLGGAVARLDRTATAFGDRSAPYSLIITSEWENPGETESNVSWTRENWHAIRPHAKETVYINYLGDEQERVPAAYGTEKYDRLASVKAKYDPTNVFHLNQNIIPHV
jgi:FAD/FMN-containing dehydrogenase